MSSSRSDRDAAGLRPIVERILDQYALDPRGPHGVAHWARVLENGRRLARSTGATLHVVEPWIRSDLGVDAE
jgi:hypothetical protein